MSPGVLALFALTYWAFIKTVRGQWLDERALLGARRFVQDTPALRNELEWFTQIPVAIGIAGLALTIINVFIRRSVLVPAIALGATGAGVVCVRILKEVLLERPFTGVSPRGTRLSRSVGCSLRSSRCRRACAPGSASSGRSLRPSAGP